MKRVLLASKVLPWLFGAALMLLSGCSAVTLTNLTSSSIPENPSGIYTFTLRVVKNFDNVQDGSISARIVVDGQTFPMRRSTISPDVFEFEYQLPAGRNAVAYYYLVQYGTPNQSETYTGVMQAKIENRYVLSLEANRGPVGSSVGIVGRGFSPRDVINLDGSPARTVFASSSALSFFVPPLPSDHNYNVTLNGLANSPVGTFHIDPTAVTASPASLALAPGEKVPLTFTLATPAPSGGILLDVTTDAPDSVIMPEVLVPQGQTSINVVVEGGKPGSGNLFLKGYGSPDLVIPVTVSGK